MFNTCEFHFENNPEGIFYAGQLLKGTVTLQVMNPKKVRNMYIRVKGEASTCWEDDFWENSDNEIYLAEKKYLMDKSAGQMRLEFGTHEYTFEFTLPSNLPSSFEGKYGTIKYSIQVVLQVSLGVINDKFKQPFKVIKALNLNDDPLLQQPLHGKIERGLVPFCKWFSPSNKLKIAAWAPVGGYLPRQTVNLEINVNNRSGAAVAALTVQLIQFVKYTGISLGKDEKIQEISLLKHTTDGCNENEEKAYNIDVEIPPTIPTEMFACKIIKIRYLIRIKAIMKSVWSFMDPTLDLPITIGAYPSRDGIAPIAPPHPNDPPNTFADSERVPLL